uniref:Uncharacterized protein n=1 Tax=Tetraselmis sp. GSL018 TaxID=582737 RepID=A0A061RSF2_9CHLO
MVCYEMDKILHASGDKMRSQMPHCATVRSHEIDRQVPRPELCGNSIEAMGEPFL